MALRAVVFDAYGTLLDVHAAMERHADKLPPDWERISVEWRNKQLEYSWIATLSGPGHYRDFWSLTEAALDFVLARHRLTDPAIRAALLDTYRTLPAYADAAPMLRSLRAKGLRTAILSNGEASMLADAVAAAKLGDLLDAVISVDPIRTYKPSPAVYDLAADALGIPIAQMGFVSSNAWDAQGAVQAGFRVFWCNRADNPVEYGLGEAATVINSLDALGTALG
ncbi:MAG: haloacid dehalogenase type II [Janthinobacterium lividum]